MILPDTLHAMPIFLLKQLWVLLVMRNLAAQLGYKDIAKKYHDTAIAMVPRWMQLADAGDHYALTFDNKNTWSQKYNMVWDKILGFDFFQRKCMRKKSSIICRSKIILVFR